MKEIFSEHKNRFGDTSLENKDKVKIFQIFSNEGKIIVGNKIYPITYGGLYFIDCNQEYSIHPEDKENYLQNGIMINAKLLDDLAKLLDFEKVIEDIFKSNGSKYLTLEHYKIVDSRFKEIHGIYNANNHYSKALFISKVMDIFNYVVITGLRKKK